MKTTFAVVCAAAAATTVLAQPEKDWRKAPDFVTVLQRNFKAWDKDKNGLLSPAEIEEVLTDPKLKGEDAAAAATVKCVARDKFYVVKRVDVPTIKEDIRLTSKRERGREPGDDWLLPNWQQAFTVVWWRVMNWDEAKGAGVPTDISTLGIHYYGSRVFPVVLAGLVTQQPQAAQGMVSAGVGGGKTKIETPLWSVEIDPVTIAQGASCSTFGNAWARTVECGLDAFNAERFPQATFNGKTATFENLFHIVQDYITLLTGRQSTVMYFRAATGGRNGQQFDYQPLGNPEGLATSLVQPVGQALTKKRVVVARGDNNTMMGANTKGPAKLVSLPPGIPPFVCATVLSMDAKNITLWMVDSGNFSPKGAPSITNGYAITGGKLTMPVTDFVQVFSGIVIETDSAGSIPGQSRRNR
ncbi:MAG: hypothetical protein JSS51_10230 [Planctomycetes bacterium]|nr:hypothetical protein [Planctomycetota bacterium]